MSTRPVFAAWACRFGTLSLIGLLAHGAKAAESYTENPGAEGDGKFTIGPEYKIDPDLTDRGNPKGKYFEFTMRLADTKSSAATIPHSSRRRSRCEPSERSLF